MHRYSCIFRDGAVVIIISLTYFERPICRLSSTYSSFIKNNQIIGVHIIIYHRLRRLVYSNSGIEGARVNIHPSDGVGEKNTDSEKNTRIWT